MSPILGIWASQNYPRVTTAYESIATSTVGSGGSSTITFSSIPSTFAHLQIRVMQITSGGYAASTTLRFNSDTGANYAYHYLLGDGSSATAGNGVSQTSILPFFNGNTTSPWVAVIDILDYTSTAKQKTIRSLNGSDNNGSGYAVLGSGLYKPSTIAAIDTITITSPSGSFSQYSSFALYGIK